MDAGRLGARSRAAADRAGRAVRHLAADRADRSRRSCRAPAARPPARPPPSAAQPSGWMVARRMGHASDVDDNGSIPTLSSVGFERSRPAPASRSRGPGTSGRRSAPATPIRNALTGVFVGLIVLIVLGAMFITAEYRRGLIHTTLTASPRRGHVLIAKAVVIAGGRVRRRRRRGRGLDPARQPHPARERQLRLSDRARSPTCA